ncbi:MAG: patatin-like phospholipase family protein [Actinomycetota bacterium]|jgi:NTE family protein|nr:patatin-like phospholipase family protein [Actinomycetota bacterium]
MTTRALVLGGGGLAGIAWETGVLRALVVAGVDVNGADVVVGTSAGATVAAQLGTGLPIDDWYRRQVDPALQNDELRPTGMSTAELRETMLRIAEECVDPVERSRRIGALALAAGTVAEPVRRKVISGRVPADRWPDRRTLIVAVDATSGERRVFDGASGVSLVDAVAASCAVPGIWPPVTIGTTRYMDGGVHSICNADLAAGHQRILVLAPMADPQVEREVAALSEASRVLLVSADAEATTAFGPDPLDPSVRTPAARAGDSQGRGQAAAIADLWRG